MREDLIYLDGHNNPGFSGGPVVFWNYQLQRNQIAGIISGYHPQYGSVEQRTNSNTQVYHENSGIGIAYSIRKATDLIKSIFAKDLWADA